MTPTRFLSRRRLFLALALLTVAAVGMVWLLAV
jgi:hypothetical protein